MLIIRSLFVFILSAAAVAAADLPVLRGAARVVDGDTLEIGGQAVRLFGIDAPEHDQSCTRGGAGWACGAWSQQVLTGLAQGALRCEAQGIDRYGRVIAVCRAGQADLAMAMVQAGAATAYRRYSQDYVAAEGVAKAAGLGIWAGQMQAPEAFRHPATVAQEAPGGCVIKGNIGASGRIYHVPGQEDYDATRISPAKGEGWFCSEDDARAAGFRAARR